MVFLPTIGFDTRGVNQLEDGGARAEQLMKALRCGFEVLLPAMTVEEILSTPTSKGQRRESLLARCEQLVGSGKCVWPPHWILRLLISEHAKNPSMFNWAKMDMRARIYEIAITRREFTEELCDLQRKKQFEGEERFTKPWKELRSKLDEVFAKEPNARPTAYRDAVAIANVDGGVLWSIGRGLYDYVTGSKIDETQIKNFIEACPPFRAACFAFLMSWYLISLKTKLPQDNAPAGRNDLMMAAFTLTT
jgi:hypothetical protein